MHTRSNLAQPMRESPLETAARIARSGRVLVVATFFCLLAACAAPRAPDTAATVSLPLLQGWFENASVFYLTTDVSDAQVAQSKGANFAPRLSHALPASISGAQAEPRSALDKVYAITNFSQGSVFASAPDPMGHLNRESAYSPLWRMVTVTWNAGQSAHLLKSEEAVLDAAEKGLVTLKVTSVVLNCPIVHRGAKGGLPGAVM